MPNKRIFLKVDLKDEDLKKKLDDMVRDDANDLGEMNTSTFVRNLIRNEYAVRHYGRIDKRIKK